ncbi:MAG: hypothetical protein AAFR90_02820 [Pseudomonadota bacterium]
MSTTYEEALQAADSLTGSEQRALAVELLLRQNDDAAPLQVPDEIREKILRSKEEASRGEFLSDDEVRAIWAKHGL